MDEPALCVPVLATIPGRDGDLQVTVWESSGPDVLAIHGLAATSSTWGRLSALLGGSARVVAPDLRGRGGSRALPPPFGLDVHLADLERTLEALVFGPVVLVGHSMGAVLASELAARHPDRVEGLVLVDGGLRLAPRAWDVDAMMRPLARRLGRTYPDRAAYHRLVRMHPVYAPHWDGWMEATVAAELEPRPGGFVPAFCADAVRTDAIQLRGRESDDHRRPDPARSWACPVVFVRPGRGLAGEAPGLYDDAVVARYRLETGMRVVDLPDENHYGVVLTAAGATAVTAAVMGLLGGSASLAKTPLVAAG